MVVSNTGPLISAFQSDSFSLLVEIFETIYISRASQAELIDHGWEREVAFASKHLVVLPLSQKEKETAQRIARQIAKEPVSTDSSSEHHLGEAEAIVLMDRSEFRDELLLLDDSAARNFASQLNLSVSGFAGVLLRAVQAKLITASELRHRMEKCRVAGTHYSTKLIDQTYAVALEME